MDQEHQARHHIADSLFVHFDKDSRIAFLIPLGPSILGTHFRTIVEDQAHCLRSSNADAVHQLSDVTLRELRIQGGLIDYLNWVLCRFNLDSGG